MQPSSATAGPDVVREAGPDQTPGLEARDPKKVLPPRRPTDRHHAISTSATETPFGYLLCPIAITVFVRHCRASELPGNRQ